LFLPPDIKKKLKEKYFKRNTVCVSGRNSSYLISTPYSFFNYILLDDYIAQWCHHWFAMVLLGLLFKIIIIQKYIKPET